MFKEVFDFIHDKNPEIQFVGVWGKDGLELERASYLQFGIDTELLGAELADIISRLDKIKTLPTQVHMEYFFDQFKVTVFSLNRDYFLFVISTKDLITGKIKFFYNLIRDKIVSFL